MRAEELYAFVGIAATLGIMVGMTMTTVAYTQTAVADRGGRPDDSATSGPACDKANDRNNAFHDRQDTLGNQGQDVAHTESNHNGRGVESTYCL
jgi:hypothetical protein